MSPVKEGDVLDGKYRVERVLGLGGMGVVVAAKHLQLDQRVAIKFVRPEAIFNAEAMERFAREARAAVKLRSEHVARVLDVGTMSNGVPYMVMEYLEGRDLGDRIEKGETLSPPESVDYVLQACEAVAEAHAIGIIHRDLKPRNLFVTHGVDGRPLVKVLDFGISKQTSMGSSGNDLSLTRTATVMGSPNYMSPEQLRSAKGVDARTDIWALGVILYEALTGRVPFEAETVTQLTAMVLQDQPRPIGHLRGDVPPGLARAITRCLEKDPAARFASVAELAREIEQYGTTRGIAQKIAQVTGSSGGRSPESAPATVRAATGGTSVAWGDTQLAAPPRRWAIWIGGASLLVLLTVGGTLLGVRMMHASASGGPLGTPTVRQIEIAGPPPALPAPSPPPAPAPSAAPVPVAQPVPAPIPSSVPSVAKPPPPRTRPPASTPPKTAKPQPTDAFPDERN